MLHLRRNVVNTLPWALIFIGSSSIFLAGHIFDLFKSKKIRKRKILSLELLIPVVMSLFYLGSVGVYNLANNSGEQKYIEEYIWPMFMGFIILSSTIISYINKEWKGSKMKVIGLNIISVLILISSILILAISAFSI